MCLRFLNMAQLMQNLGIDSGSTATVVSARAPMGTLFRFCCWLSVVIRRRCLLVYKT